MLLNRKNSTKLGPNYKPKNVDSLRRKKINPDAICTVEIPFSTDLETGVSRSIYSIDCMSMLSGSDTFNQFAKVFDEFKIQNYHLCIDMSKPASINTTAQNIFTLPWALANAVYTVNGEVQAITSEAQFKQKIKDALILCTITDAQGGILNMPTESEKNMIPLMLYVYAYGNYGVVVNNNTMGLANEDEITATINADARRTVKLEVDDFELNDIDVIITTYQIVGSCGLRQIPKNYYNFSLGNMNGRQIPDIYSDAFVESVGNYIWQSYMPGAPLHLSMEMKGTSATEKSLYYPTSVVYNLSGLDSFNQSGRFSPVTLLQNKLGNTNGRNMYTNGNGYVGSYDAVYLDTYRSNAYTELDPVCGKLTFSVQNGDNVYKFEFNVGKCPVSYDSIGDRYMYDSGKLFNAVLSENNLDHHVSDATNNYGSFVLIGDNGINLSQMAYYLYDSKTTKLESFGGSFSIQAYVTCKFRSVRNILSHNQVVYPYLISAVRGGFTLNNERFTFEDNYILPLNVTGFNETTKTFMPIMKSQNGRGFIYACGYRTKVMNNKIFNGRLLLPNGTVAGATDYTQYALGGFITKVNPVGMKMDYCVFNQFNSFDANGITLQSVIGNNTEREYDVVAYIFVVFNDNAVNTDFKVSPQTIPVIPVNTEMNYGNGKVTIEGIEYTVTNLTNFSTFELDVNLSRIRSMGITDGGKNSIIEHNLNYESLSKGISAGNYASPSVVKNGVYYCTSFGGIVGNKIPNVTNLI